ncbi:hypothetical protein [Streptomyces sp. CA-106110]|uniref:hypothetical protein n=1 Tax=Streptomyces sp. CA-106110 TaxID=3240044 RepID=UPI003D91C809
MQRRITASCGQEAFLDGHVHAFRTLGGIPAGQIRYDNLSPAVSRVIRKSRSREEHPRWADFRKHFSITPFYCEPGLRGAHEKGGVEGQVGYWRRNYLTPVPRVDSLDELNEAFARFEQAEESRRIGLRIRTIGQDFAHEAPLLLPLPGEGFETGLAFSPRVDRYGMVAAGSAVTRSRPGSSAAPSTRCCGPTRSWSSTAARRSPATRG